MPRYAALAPGQRRPVRLPRGAAGRHRGPARQRRRRLRAAPPARALARGFWTAVGRAVAGGATFKLAVLCLQPRHGRGARRSAAYLFRQGELTLGTVYLIFAYTEILRRPLERITRQIQDLQQAAASVVRVRELLAERSGDRRRARRAAAGRPAGGRARRGLVRLRRRPSRSCATSRSGSSPARCSACSAAPAPARPRSRGCSSGSTTRPPARSGSAASTCATAPVDGAARRGRPGHPGRPALPRQRARQRDPLRPRDRGRGASRRCSSELGLGALAGAACRTGSTPCWRRRRRPLGRRGAAARLRARVPEGPRPGRLDEASSRLDPATERLLERAVDRLLAGRTAIVIAHRLATVERADRILILEDGRVVEEGDRAALAADPGSRFAGCCAPAREARGGAGVSALRAGLAAWPRFSPLALRCQRPASSILTATCCRWCPAWSCAQSSTR